MKSKVEYLVQYFRDIGWWHWSDESSLKKARAAVKDIRCRYPESKITARIIRREITETIIEEVNP